MIPQTWSRSVVGLVVGGIVLALVTALLSSAVYSFSAASKANDLSKKFIEANNHLSELQTDSEASEDRAARAQQERADLMEQNEALERQVAALVRFLRSHGIEVPNQPGSPPMSTPPAQPSPSGTRPPIQRSPQTPSRPIGICALIPALCDPILGRAVGREHLPHSSRTEVPPGQQSPGYPQGSANRPQRDRP